MNIHEYQAKEVLKGYGVRIQEGIVASTPEEAHEAAVKLNAQTGTSWFVIKAQIHAGGRGQGEVKEIRRCERKSRRYFGRNFGNHPNRR
jgi:succinyl-CoA synthetase beta subunit